jgi:tetratricopeptide (TPR) repeat protein
VVEYKKAVDLKPYSPKCLNKLGYARVMAGDYKGAIEPLVKSAQLYPTLSNTFFNLGLAYKGMKDNKRAIESFQDALAINPYNPFTYRSLIEIYRATGDQQSALKMEENLKIISMNK